MSRHLGAHRGVVWGLPDLRRMRDVRLTHHPSVLAETAVQKGTRGYAAKRDADGKIELGMNAAAVVPVQLPSVKSD